MGNIYTGSNSGKAGLNVKKTDNTVDVFGVSQIQLDSNLTLTDNGNGSVTINSTGGGGGGGGVTQLSFGSTGLTPAVATTGSITVAGTLEVGSGGTGLNSLGSADEFLKVNNGATALEYSTGLTYVSTAGSRQLKIVDTGVDDMFVVESTDNDATNAPDVKLYRNSSSPAADDLIGAIKFNANEGNTGGELTYARIESRLDSAGVATYGGSLDFYITNDAAEVRMLTISGEIVGDPNMSFDVNPDGDVDGDFRHLSLGGTVNIFSDAQNRTLDIAPIKNYGFGGTATPLDGELLIGNGSTFSKANLTQGSGITITDGAGSIEIATDGTSPTGTGSANQVTYWSGASTITGDSNFTFNPTNGALLIKQQTTGTAGLTLQIDDDGATASPDLKLFHNSTSPAANDDLGHVHFQGKNSAAATVSYADIFADILDPADGGEAGRIFFRVRTATNSGNLTDMLSIRGDGNPAVVVNDSGRADVDFRVETDNQTSAFFVDASADNATFNVDVGIGTTP